MRNWLRMYAAFHLSAIGNSDYLQNSARGLWPVTSGARNRNRVRQFSGAAVHWPDRFEIAEVAGMTRYLFGPITEVTPLPGLDAARQRGDCRTFSHKAGVADFHLASDVSWDAIRRQFPGDWRPEVLLAWLPYTRIPAWVWTAPIPVIGLAADWNLLWHGYRQIAPLCDAVLTDGPGVQHFRRAGFAHVHAANLYGPGPEWFGEPADAPRDIDVLFVGNLNPGVQSERLAWLGRLGQWSDRRRVVIRSGVFGAPYRDLIRRAKIVFNRSVRGECNQRVFEAVAGGALLLQEVGNLEVAQYFTPGREYIPYDGGDLDETIERCLQDEPARLAIVRSAQERGRHYTFEGLIRAGVDALDRNTLHRRMQKRLAATSPLSLMGRVWASVSLADPDPDPTLVADLTRAGELSALGLFATDRSTAESHVRAAAVGSLGGRFGLALLLYETDRHPEAEIAANGLLTALGACEALLTTEHDTPLGPIRFDTHRAAWERAAWSNAGDRDGEGQAKRRLLLARTHELLAELTGDPNQYGAAAKLLPDDAAAQAAFGCALARADRPAEACEALGRAVGLNPFDRRAARALFQSHLDAGRLEDAGRLAQARLRLHRAAPTELPAEAYFAPAPNRAATILSQEAFAARFGAVDTKTALIGFTNAIDTRALLTLVGWLRPRNVLEIGTAAGHTTANFTAFTPSDAVIHTVGLSAHQAGASTAEQAYEVPPDGQFGVWADHFGLVHKVRFLTADSRQFDFASFGPLDFVFLDGGHDYETVRSDSANAYSALRPGGVLVWHDYGSTTEWVKVAEAIASLGFAEGVAVVAGTEIAFLIKGEGVGGRVGSSQSELAIAWEGEFEVRHSLAIVNRALGTELVRRGHRLEMKSVPGRNPQQSPWPLPTELAAESNRPATRPGAVHVRHSWPPQFDAPPTGAWVLVQPWEFGRLPRAWIEPIRSGVDEVWAYSRAVARCYVASGVPEERVHIVPLGVDPDRFRPGLVPLALQTTARVKLLFVGGTIARKGFDLLLAAYSAAFRKHDGVCLVVKDMGVDTYYRGQTAGDAIAAFQAGPDAPAIEYFHRDLSDADLPRLYAACDVLVHPYRGEGFGLPVLEAMACGLPVVVTAGGSTEDFVPPAAGWRIPARVSYFAEDRVGDLATAGRPWWLEPEPEALVAILREVVANAEERGRRGESARRAALGWTWARSAAAVEDRVKILRTRPPLRFRQLGREPIVAAPQLQADVVPRNGVTLCMIVRDEESNIGACLESIRGLVGEIVVVDTGSTDRTREIARDFGAKVFEFPWIDDFAAARNEALRHATLEWIFWMDADDRVDDANRAKLGALFAGLQNENAAYVMKCICVPDGPGGTATTVDHVRLFRRDSRVRWTFRVHEQILPALRAIGAEIRWADAAVEHVGYVDAALRQKKLARDTRLLERALDDRPDDPFALFNLGAVYHERGDCGDAVPILEKSLRLSHPKDSIVRKLYALIAQCHARLGDSARAIQTCRAGREQTPDDAELLFLEAGLQRDSKKYATAEQLYRRLLDGREAPHFASVDTGLRTHKAHHNLGLVYLDLGWLGQARDQWRAALANHPGFVPSLLALGELALRERDWAGVAECTTRLQPFGPAAAIEAERLSAQTEIERGDFSGARRRLAAALCRDPLAVPLLVAVGHAWLREGGHDREAEAALRAVLAVAPQHAESRHNLDLLLQKRS